MKIITVTLNPCIDADYVTDKPFAAGQLNRVSAPSVVFSGKGVNVSRYLKKLHEYSTAMMFLAGDSGDKMENSLRDEGIGVCAVHVPGSLRRNTSILDCNGQETQINEPGAEISEENVREFVGLFKSEVACPDKVTVIISGSVPPGVPKDIYKKLCVIAKNSGAYVVLDCDGEALRAGLDGTPDLIKPNREELEALIGRTLEGEGEGLRIDAVRAALEFCRNNHVAVLCTLGGDGSVFAGPEGSYMCEAVKTEVRTFKGAGDTFLASFIYHHAVRDLDCDSAMALCARETSEYLSKRR